MGLDLSGIESWTHELLEEIARKRGIRNPEFRRHAELVRLLLRQQYGEHLQAGREQVARGVMVAGVLRDTFGKLVGAAIGQWVPPSLAALLGAGRTELPRASAGGTHASAPRSPSPLPPAPQPVRTTPKAQVAAATRTFVEAPHRTRAMARLLAAGGHRDRALSIYAELLEQDHDGRLALREEMDAIERGETVHTNLNAARSSSARVRRLPPSADRLLCDLAADGSLRVQWSISEAGRRRARAVLAEDGELALRLVCVERDPQAVVHSAVTERGPLEASGVWTSPPQQSGAPCVVAVGVRSGDRFVAIVHATPKHAALKHATLPRALPVPRSA